MYLLHQLHIIYCMYICTLCCYKFTFNLHAYFTLCIAWLCYYTRFQVNSLTVQYTAIDSIDWLLSHIEIATFVQYKCKYMLHIYCRSMWNVIYVIKKNKLVWQMQISNETLNAWLDIFLQLIVNSYLFSCSIHSLPGIVLRYYILFHLHN